MNEGQLRVQVSEVVRQRVKKTVNCFLDAEMEALRHASPMNALRNGQTHAPDTMNENGRHQPAGFDTMRRSNPVLTS